LGLGPQTAQALVEVVAVPEAGQLVGEQHFRAQMVLNGQASVVVVVVLPLMV
jgi:hypothetical protein